MRGSVTHTLLACAILVGLVGCGADSPSSTEIDRDGAASHEHTPPGKPHKEIQPARIVEHPQGFFSTTLLWPLKNEWLVANHDTFTAVDAGLDPRHPTDGIFGIFRQDYVRVRQREDFVKVPGSGAVTITKAPLGSSVVTWAQNRGNIKFTGENGIKGTLHLEDDTVTLDRNHGSVEMSTHPSCELPGGSEYFMPELNLWRADTKHRTTIVCAGGASNDKPGAGRFLIIRAGGHWTKSRRGVDVVTVAGVGPVKITKAPLGSHAATRAQRDGNLEFRAHNGVTGTLHLSDDTVTLDP